MNLSITKEEKSILLNLARKTIAARLDGKTGDSRSLPEADGTVYPALSMPCGAFVTLHKSEAGNRRLRGCIGRMAASAPLQKTVQIMALEAAFGDPRFPPLAAEEFPFCDIEISVLSPMKKCSDPRSVQIGIHGLYLTYHGCSGVLLPQVPVEQGWNLDEYLDYICIKAGVPAKSYNAPGAELLIFTTVVFGECPGE